MSFEIPIPGGDRPRYERLQAVARSHLEESAWQKAREEGRTMTLDEAVAYAMEEDQRA